MYKQQQAENNMETTNA